MKNVLQNLLQLITQLNLALLLGHPIYITFSKQPIQLLSLPLRGTLVRMFPYYFKNHFFLFQLNAYNMLNTHIYHHLPPTCFGICYTTFRETFALLVLNYAYSIPFMFL